MSRITEAIDNHIEVVKKLDGIENFIFRSTNLICKSLIKNKNIFWCGNGGSAADSQHLAAEFLGRFTKNRKPLNSIALSTDTSTLTCISNDFSFSDIFSRQIEAIGNKGDTLICISTSGNSKNLLKAIISAKKKSMNIISLLGKNGGKMKNRSHVTYIVDSDVTARIQECHILIGHIICAEVEKKLKLV
tara:strand:- start:13 stop:579 length:567 start_codon:yes stop_codon:yes gene_type:complete